MTRDQKTVLKAVGVMLVIKASIYAGIVYSSRYYRKAMSDK
jgi:hypothetical protein